jgi:hypothetical protein
MNACGQPNSVRWQGDPCSESAGSKERTLTSLRSIVPGSSLPIGALLLEVGHRLEWPFVFKPSSDLFAERPV